MSQNSLCFDQRDVLLRKQNINEKPDNNKVLINRILTSIVLVSFVILFLFIGASSLNLFGFNNFNI
ncbi:hypothetical protein IKS57_02960, partial [bacterium]|nr:hypothetical protein [bacterium]